MPLECGRKNAGIAWSLFFSPKIDLFSRKERADMAGETVCQTSETVNSLKHKIAGPSLLLYRFDALIIPDQFNWWCLFSFRVQSAILTRLGSVL